MIYEAVDVKDIQTILDPVKGIAINSQFTFAKIIENGTNALVPWIPSNLLKNVSNYRHFIQPF